MSDDFIDLLIRQRWQEITSGFHNFVSGPGGYMIVCLICVFGVYFFSRLTKEK